VAEQNPPSHQQNRADHKAEQDRNLLQSLFGSTPGVISSGDLAVTQNGTPNMSVNVAAGKAIINGSDTATQGAYHVWNDAPKNLVIAASDPTNARWDLVVAKVQDAYYSGAVNVWTLVVITGAPAGSPVDPAIPNNCIKLGRVVVAANATTILNASIVDLRPVSSALGGTISCTSTRLPANPYPGMSVWLTDTGRYLVYTTATTGWQPPWGAAWGHLASPIASATATTGVTTATTDVTGITITTPVLASNRRIQTHVEVNGLSTVASDVIRFTITDASNVVKRTFDVQTAGSSAIYSATFSFDEVSTGVAVTRKVRMVRVTGSGSCQAFADATRLQTMTIADLGPSAAPV
jgi:hypothetical protein